MNRQQARELNHGEAVNSAGVGYGVSEILTRTRG
jgi:hypothetical protein